MDLSKYIEHTLLKPNATKEEFIKLFEEAKMYNFFGVCINPCHVKSAKEYLGGSDVKIVTVCGFPLGASSTEVKAFEAQRSVEDGADEVDMVINLTAMKDHDYDFVRNDVETVKKACQDRVLKVILETDLLTKDEIAKACEICVEAGADFVKTSTGFVKDGVGAKVEDIVMMYAIVSPHGLRVKASGGIRDAQKALALVQSGAARLGTSSSISIIKG